MVYELMVMAHENQKSEYGYQKRTTGWPGSVAALLACQHYTTCGKKSLYSLKSKKKKKEKKKTPAHYYF